MAKFDFKKSLNFSAKILLKFEKEIPHGVAIIVNQFELASGNKMYNICSFNELFYNGLYRNNKINIFDSFIVFFFFII